MKKLSFIIILLLTGSAALAQYNPLWIRHCRAIPKVKAEYDELVPIIKDKLTKRPDVELRFLLGICQFGAGFIDEAVASFDNVVNSQTAKADIVNDAINYKKYLKNGGFTDQIEVVAPYANIRKQPQDKAPLKGRVYKGEDFTILEEKGKWAYVINIENQGWVLTMKNGSSILKKL